MGSICAPWTHVEADVTKTRCPRARRSARAWLQIGEYSNSDMRSQRLRPRRGAHLGRMRGRLARFWPASRIPPAGRWRCCPTRRALTLTPAQRGMSATCLVGYVLGLMVWRVGAEACARNHECGPGLYCRAGTCCRINVPESCSACSSDGFVRHIASGDG